MDSSLRDEIIRRLTEKGAVLPCPRCGTKSFNIIDGYFVHPLQEEPGGIVIGGQSVPAVAVVCANCGYLAQHALGALGLLPPSRAEAEDEKK